MFELNLSFRPLRALTAAASAAVMLTVAACGGGSAEADGLAVALYSTCGEVPSGPQSDAIAVTGQFGKEHEVTLDTPLKPAGMQRTIVKEGSDEPTQDGDHVELVISIFNGRDGEPVGAPAQEVTLQVGNKDIYQVFAASYDCISPGSRVVVTAPVSDLYGEDGEPEQGLSGDDVLVVVTDVLGTVDPADVEEPTVPDLPKPKRWKGTLPEVTFADEGPPTLVLPEEEPPSRLLLSILTEGTGDTVAATDTVVLHYQGTGWNSGEIFDQSYGGTPAVFPVGGVVPGFAAALVDQKVGTRLVVSMPPELAYGTDPEAHELGGETLVFIIEILDVEPASPTP